jgi:hypothetical protein
LSVSQKATSQISNNNQKNSVQRTGHRWEEAMDYGLGCRVASFFLTMGT